MCLNNLETNIFLGLNHLVTKRRCWDPTPDHLGSPALDLHVEHPASDHLEVLKHGEVGQLLWPGIDVQITCTGKKKSPHSDNCTWVFTIVAGRSLTNSPIPVISSSFLKALSCFKVRPDVLVTGSLNKEEETPKAHCYYNLASWLNMLFFFLSVSVNKTSVTYFLALFSVFISKTRW